MHSNNNCKPRNTQDPSMLLSIKFSKFILVNPLSSLSLYAVQQYFAEIWPNVPGHNSISGLLTLRLRMVRFEKFSFSGSIVDTIS